MTATTLTQKVLTMTGAALVSYALLVAAFAPPAPASAATLDAPVAAVASSAGR
jgi:hypothetical protein